MKTTIRHANLAPTIKADMLSRTRKSGKPMFKEIKTEHGYKIVGKRRNEAGEVVTDTIIEYSSVPAPSLSYNENLITI